MNEKNEILKEFENIEFLTPTEIQELNFEELSVYLQWINNLSELHQIIKTGDNNG